MTFLRVCQTGNPTIVPAQRDPESKGHTTKDELFLRVHACFQSILAWAHLSYNVAFKFVAYRKGTSFAFLVDIWSRRWLRRLLKKFSLLNTVEPETDFYYSQAPISIAGVVQFFFPLVPEFSKLFLSLPRRARERTRTLLNPSVYTHAFVSLEFIRSR